MTTLPQETQDVMLEEAAKAAPNEAVGFVLLIDGKEVAFPVVNQFSGVGRGHIDGADFAKAEGAGNIVGIYHSHVNRSCMPSAADKTTSERHKLKLFIVGWPIEQIYEYEPQGWRAPLVGREWCYGVHDCYAIVRDHFQMELGIELPDFERDPKSEKNNLLPYIEESGFEEAQGLQRHDVLVLQINSPDFPNHCAVYLGDGLMVHHLQNDISKIQPYIEGRGYYFDRCWGVYRHKSLLPVNSPARP